MLPHIFLFIFVMMLLGGVGASLSFFIPHHYNFTSDHTTGAGVAGIMFGVFCFVISMVVLVNSLDLLKHAL